MKVSESVKKRCDVLSCIPPDFKTAETLFAEQQPTEQELMWLAVELADNTFGEYRDMLNENCPRVTPGKVHRDYLYDTILFLLDHEMNPNTVVDEHTTEAENIMAVLRFTDGPDVAARTMRLLLEHGGDPNLDVDSLTPLSWMDDELCIDPIWERWCCDHLVQCLMVMQAYGGGWHGTDGKFHRPFSMCEGYRSEIFKEFEKFDYRFGTEKGHLGPIHIFEKATGTVVADYI